MNKSMIFTMTFPCLLISPIMLCSMNSMFSIWLTMELNIMSFIPISTYFNKLNKESSIKYFIIQALSSSGFIFMSNWLMLNSINLEFIITSILQMMMMIKLGCPPFHSWFINLMNSMDWISCLLLSTWQKLIPFITLMNFMNKNLIMIFSILACITGSIFGLNHQSLRIMFAYSSTNHLSWLLMNIMISEKMFLFYFFTYSIINISIMTNFNNMKIFYLNNIFQIKLNNIYKFLMMMNLFSISSLPPLYGFILKIYSINIMINNKINLILLLMIWLSIIPFIFYMRINFILIMKNIQNLKINILFNLLNFKSSIFSMILWFSFYFLWIIMIWYHY